MNKKDLTIVIPSIKPHLWQGVYDSIIQSIGNYTFDIIFIGPQDANLPYNNILFIKSLACPSICLQMGALLANSEFISWCSDDCLFLPQKLSLCLDLAYTIDHKDGIIVRYCEGINHSGTEQTHPAEYCEVSYSGNQPWYHDLIGVPNHYKFMLIGMLQTEYFYELGGMDCRYEHVNYCCHDISFRLQNNGGNLHFSPGLIISANFDSGADSILQDAFWKNDLPKFREFYLQSHNPNYIKINYDNWKEYPSIWSRRFPEKH